MDSEDALAGVEKGEIVLPIITLPLNLPNNLQAKSLWHDPMQVVCTKDNPLAYSTDVNDLATYPAVLPGTYTFTRQLVENELNNKGLQIIDKSRRIFYQAG